MKSVAAAVAFALLSIPLLARQQPSFRSGTRTVAIYATVTDADGRLVTNLTRDDFEVLEDGKVQPLTLFSAESQPITVVLMLDRSGSMKSSFRLVEAAAEEFVRRMLPGDRARIGNFAERIELSPPEFTGDQQQLVGLLRSTLQPEGPTPLWNAVDTAMTALKEQEGRRVVLVFTDGHDNPNNLRFNNNTVMDAVERGRREDVMVYAVGLESRTPPRVSGRGGFPGGFGGNPLGVERPDPGLPMIAAETGGGYFELTRANDLAATFTRVAEELHKQYALGFEPTKRDGKAHKLKVRVKGKGMTVRARKSYVASN